MLDDTFPWPGLADRPRWQDRALAVLEPQVPSLRDALGGDGRPDRLDLALIKDGPEAVTLELSAGDETGVLKIFDGPDADRLYLADRNMLLGLRATGLVPKLRHYSDAGRWIVTEIIPETLGKAHVLRWGAEGFGYRLGDWCARYDAIAPSRPGAASWLDYARALRPALPFAAVAGAAEALAAVPTGGSTLAHNDAGLENLLYDPARGLLCCDFARAAWRPRGWDYVVARQAVMQRFPREGGAILFAMTEGFEEAHRGALRVDELDRVAEVLFALFAVAGRPEAEGGSDGH